MTVAFSIWIAVGSVGFMAVALIVTFSRIDENLDSIGSYEPCDGCWHEAILHDCRTGLKDTPQQPVNTYTSLAYVGTGVFVALLVNDVPSYVFMVSMCFLGLGSALYHGLSVRWAGHLDVLTIYWVFLDLLLYASRWLLPRIPAAVIAVSMFVGAGLVASVLRLVMKKIDIYWKIAILLLVVLVLDAFYIRAVGVPHGYTKLIVAFCLLLFAFIVWFLDRKRWFRPKGFGHGLWHLSTAVGIATLFWIAA